MTLTLRPARLSDLHVLNHIKESAVRDSTAPGSPLTARLHRWNPKRSYAGPRYWRNAIVAEVDGVGGRQVVGVAKTIGAMLKDLWVLHSARSHGAGAALARAAEDRIRADGHRMAHLYTAAFNARTLAFYERNGWTLVRFTQHAVGHFRRCVYVKRL
ncbi:MAG: GNAT family N-acetyltransferase [Rhodospirillaceae bacterium]